MFRRMLVVHGTLLVVSLLVLGAATAHRSGHFELDRLENELLARARLVHESIRELPADRLQRRVEQLAASQPGNARITILDADGNVLAESDRDPRELENHSRRPEILAANEDRHGTDLRRSRSVERDLLYVAIRVEPTSAGAAYVRVALPPGEVQSFVADLWKDVSRTAVVAGLVLLAVTAGVALRITAPIKELSHAANRAAEQIFEPKVHVSGPPGVADLARSFNRMSASLATRIAKLEEDHEQLLAILGGMIEGVIGLDAEQCILFANDRAAELLDFNAVGHTSADAVGRRFWDVVRRRPVLDLVERCLTRGELQKKELNLYDRYDRAIRSLQVHAVRLPGATPRGAVLVIHDTTDLRRLERLRQEFVANVSHELKTPLTVIKANVETLLDEDALSEQPIRGFLEQIGDQSDRLHRLILDMLSLARIESGTETFVKENVNLEAIVQSCLLHRRPRAEAKRQTLTALPSPPELDAWADAEAVEEILENLVDNAINYTPAGGTITVRWWSEGDAACLEVKDDGIGIPAADLPRIFERFYRVDKARSREVGGTGLGLSIVKHLVQAMNGSVAATSSLGEGSSFVVRLPLRDPAT